MIVLVFTSKANLSRNRVEHGPKMHIGRATYIIIVLLWAHVASTLPIIDVAPLLGSVPADNSMRLNCTKAIMQALQMNGIFLIVGHGIDTGESLFHAGENLFSLEEDAKLEVAMGRDYMRGYIPLGAESGLRQSVIEPKEGFAYGYPSVSDENEDFNYLAYPNKWPRGFVAEDRGILEELYSRKVEISKAIIRAITSEVVNDVDMESMLDGGERISLMRLFHYKAMGGAGRELEGSQEKTIMGSSPHRDWGLLTLILQDDVGGLEYLDMSSSHEGRWADVEPVPGSLVVNGGDFLALLTRNRYQSPIHQVRAPTVRHRLSFVFFFYPAYGAIVPRMSEAERVEYLGEQREVQIQFNSFVSSVLTEETKFGDAMVNKWKGVQNTR